MRGILDKNVLAKRMTRKEFLQHAGGALIALFGLSNLLSLFGYEKPQLAEKAQTKDANGFGTRKFGV